MVERTTIAIVALLMVCSGRAFAETDHVLQCAKEQNDDTLFPYDPALKGATIEAFKLRFANASLPEETLLKAQTSYRCANGRLLVCFTGANLPCGKLDTSKSNPGATAFCATDRNAASVPLAATGHDAVYSYRCKDGQAVATGKAMTVDPRGFAAENWMALR